jgi:hypothetical protein
MEVFRGDMVVIQDTKRSSLFETVDTVEFVSTVVQADTPTWRIIEGDDMIGCCSVATVETCHIVVSAIAQLSRQRVVGGGKFGHLDSLECLETGEDRHGHAVCDAV